ncbi:MAG: SDR family NAD(P)-dependent oxidoreductase [bacterium]|nr:SDR family NAD(P)-dependent oxidoreductase [bacterium]
MNWQGKRVLVTGAGGFVGSHLAERLVERGADVRALVHYNALGTRGWLDTSSIESRLEVVAGDIRDEGSVREAVSGREIVFHLAALISIPYSYRAPRSYVDTNVAGTLNVLQAAKDAGECELVVHTSTSEVYGTAQYVPMDEKHPLQAQSPYSASKIAADKLAEAFHLSFDLPVVTIRPFNTFGPRQSARAVIPTIISQCLTGKPVHLGNLFPTRDFNFVENIIDGFQLAAENEAAVGRTIHLGSGREISIGDLVELIADQTGSKITSRTEDARLRPNGSEVERLVADATLARELLGFTPRVSLEEGLETTIGWIRENPHRFRVGEYVV